LIFFEPLLWPDGQGTLDKADNARATVTIAARAMRVAKGRTFYSFLFALYPCHSSTKNGSHMSVHKPKLKNIPQQVQDAFVQHHLPYELWMMREALAAAQRGAVIRFEHNLHVEGFATHARNLIEFLKNGVACGFDPADFTNNAFSVDRKFIRQTLVDMINEQISHLTSDRKENQNEKFAAPEWQETADAIEKEFARWVSNLTSDWTAKWENRERMDEAAGLEKTIRLGPYYAGACTAPTFSFTGPTGPAPPVGQTKRGNPST
jgi:hypothetical protein